MHVIVCTINISYMINLQVKWNL